MCKRKIKAPSCNQHCSGRAISNTYSECVRSNARAPYFHLWPACSTVFLHITSQWKRFKKYIESKMFILICSRIFVRNKFLSKKNSARYHKCTSVGLHVKYLLFLWDSNRNRIFLDIFSKNIKFHGNSFSRSRDGIFGGRTGIDTEGQTDT